MRKTIFGVLFMLCCVALVASGCAKKEMVKEDETLSQGGAAGQSATTPSAEPVAQEAVVKDEATAGAEIVKPFETIYFDFDSYVLRQDARDSLDRNAKWLQTNAGERIRLEGNCDERGSDEYNLALGEKRAKAAMNYLVTLGVAADRLETISFGKEKPVDPGHDEAAWAKNRRVDFVIIK